MFHAAVRVDALNMLQDYLDQAKLFEPEGFRHYLTARIKDYHGLIGSYSLDAEGNSNLRFKLVQIPKEMSGKMELARKGCAS